MDGFWPAAISSSGGAASAVSTARKKIMKQAVLDVGLREDGQQGFKVYIWLLRLIGEIMEGLQVLQHAHQAGRWQLGHDAVYDQQVVK